MHGWSLPPPKDVLWPQSQRALSWPGRVGRRSYAAINQTSGCTKLGYDHHPPKRDRVAPPQLPPGSATETEEEWHGRGCHPVRGGLRSLLLLGWTLAQQRWPRPAARSTSQCFPVKPPKPGRSPRSQQVQPLPWGRIGSGLPNHHCGPRQLEHNKSNQTTPALPHSSSLQVRDPMGLGQDLSRSRSRSPPPPPPTPHHQENCFVHPN